MLIQGFIQDFKLGGGGGGGGDSDPCFFEAQIAHAPPEIFDFYIL